MVRIRVEKLANLPYPQSMIRIDERISSWEYMDNDGLYICTNLYCIRNVSMADMRNLEPEIECEILDAYGKVRYTKISKHTAKFAATMKLAIPIKIYNLSNVFPDWEKKMKAIKLRVVFREPKDPRDPRDSMAAVIDPKNPLSAA